MKIFLPIMILVPAILLAIYFAPTQEDQEPATPKPLSAPQDAPGAPLPQPENPLSLSVLPATVIQGEPARITIHGVASPSDIKSLTFDGKSVPVFSDAGTVGALVGLDFHKTPGSYPIVLVLSDGRTVEETLEVGKRIVATEAFHIPEQLGGDTTEAEHALTATLSKDSAILNSVTATVSPEQRWEGRFRFALDGEPVITDVYGYSRKTGSVSLSHLGTDFRAAEGTPVRAIHSGKVAYTGTLRNFGKTVIVDHGLGVMSAYMHLSDIKTRENEDVKKGDVIAASGNTGYSLGPHLHLSVRIGGLSIDPQKFYELMGENE